MPKTRFYFDYAASTPVDPRVEAAMQPYFLKKFGNAGSLHSFGQEASSAMDNARETIAKALGANFREIVFTGSATESNNLALRGSVRGFTQMARGLTRIKISDNQRKISDYQRPRLIISAIEHESVLETARDLEKEGVEVVYLPVDRNGIVNLKELKSALDERTVLVSIIYANNEIGTIQPITEISEIIRNFRATRDRRQVEWSNTMSHVAFPYPLFHTDAVQALQFLDCDVNRLGVDMMTLSSHKIYGPKGVGALYVRQATSDKQNGEANSMSHVAFSISPVTTGGNQEFGLRSGTENIPLIVGFAKAVELLFSNFRQRRTGALARRSHWRRRELESKRVMKLRDYFWKELKKIYPSARTNADYMETDTKSGQRESAPAPAPKFGAGVNPSMSTTLPNFLNIYFPDYETQYLLTKFDLEGIAVSAGSACSARSAQPSYVIAALGFPEKRAKRSIRFSFGRQTTLKDIDSALKIIRKLL